MGGPLRAEGPRQLPPLPLLLTPALCTGNTEKCRKVSWKNNSDDVETSRRLTREKCDFLVHDTWIALHCFSKKLHFSNALVWGVLWICRKTVSAFAKPLLHDDFDSKMSEADEDSYKPKVASQSETKSHISYCVAAKSRITHMDTHQHHAISSSRTYHWSASFTANITHQNDNDKICKPIIFMDVAQ